MYNYICKVGIIMDKEALKLIVQNLDSLVQCLKKELYSDEQVKENTDIQQEVPYYLTDYDEVFDEDIYSD
jgi:hypothetical protein